MPIGNAVAGPLAGAFGTNRVLSVSAAILAAATLSQFLIPGVRTLARSDHPPTTPTAAVIDPAGTTSV